MVEFKPDDSKAQEIQKQVDTKDKDEANVIEEDPLDEEIEMEAPILLKKKSSITPDML